VPRLAFVTQVSPTIHLVSFALSVFYRGTGLEVVWLQFLATGLIGGLFFSLALLPFRSVAAASS
jgi:ABC-2 type transport system permease protein